MTDALKTRPERSVRYRIIRAEDGTYAVEAEPGSANPLIISGFESADEARKWVEAGDTPDAI